MCPFVSTAFWNLNVDNFVERGNDWMMNFTQVFFSKLSTATEQLGWLCTEKFSKILIVQLLFFFHLCTSPSGAAKFFSHDFSTCGKIVKENFRAVLLCTIIVFLQSSTQMTSPSLAATTCHAFFRNMRQNFVEENFWAILLRAIIVFLSPGWLKHAAILWNSHVKEKSPWVAQSCHVQRLKTSKVYRARFGRFVTLDL